jgi:hypothetical protein
MAAVKIDYDGEEREQFIPSGVFHQEKIGDALFVAVVFLMWVYMIVVFMDLRRIANQYRTILKRTHHLDQMNGSMGSTSIPSNGDGGSRVYSFTKSRGEETNNSQVVLVKPNLSVHHTPTPTTHTISYKPEHHSEAAPVITSFRRSARVAATNSVLVTPVFHAEESHPPHSGSMAEPGRNEEEVDGKLEEMFMTDTIA